MSGAWGSAVVQWQICMHKDADQGLRMKHLLADHGPECFVHALGWLQPLVAVGWLGPVRVQELCTRMCKDTSKGCRVK